MEHRRWTAIVVCLMLALAVPGIAEEGPPEIAVEVCGSHEIIPCGIVRRFRTLSPISTYHDNFRHFDTLEIERLFELIAEAEISPTQLEKGRYEFDHDGSYIEVYLEGFQDGGLHFELRGMREKPETLLLFTHDDALADDNPYFYLLSSEELKAHVLKLCRQDTYTPDELADARAIVISELSFDEEGNRTFDPIAKIEDPEQVQTVTDGIRNAKVKERLDAFLPGIRLEFEFEDGSVKYAYMTGGDLFSDPRMEAGGNYIHIRTRRMLKIIGDLLL